MKPLDHVKRRLLYVLVASVLAGAVFGISAVLRNQWNWYEIRVLLTTVVLAAASLCGLACDLSRTPRGMNLIPIAGMILTGFAMVLTLTLVWYDFGRSEWVESYMRVTACVSVFAVATAHFSLLSVARLSPRFRWVLLLAFNVIYALASLLASLILMTPVDIGDQLVRTIAVLAILDVALSLVIPLLHRISKTDESFTTLSPQDERNVAAVDAEIEKLQRRLVELQALRVKLGSGA